MNSSEAIGAIVSKLEQGTRTEECVVEFDGIKVPYRSTRDYQGRIQISDLASLVGPYRKNPVRREGTARFTDRGSFEAHAVRFKSEASALWADRGQRVSPKLVSVLDYHPEGSASAAAFGQHRGAYSFPLSDEWKAWTEFSGVPMSQVQFAEFIEERMIDVTLAESAPSGVLSQLESQETIIATPVSLLQLSRGMKIHVASEIETAQNLSTGEAELRFSTEHRDSKGGKLRVPGAFVISVPVFHGGAPVSLAAFLRYKLDGKQVVWSFRLYRPEAAFDEAFESSCRLAADLVGMPLFFGCPE